MKRPLGRFRAIVLSMVVFYVVAAVMHILTFGTGPFGSEGPLMWPAERALDVLLPLVGDILAVTAVVLSLATPPAVCALLFFCWLVPAPRVHDGHLHCLKCGYILKGLSEPRCPECGQRI